MEITHPDKAYWPDEGHTKGDLARYYEAVFPKLKPYVEDRMLVLERCPDGMRGKCFIQKQAPKGLPKGTRTKRIQHEERRTDYVVGGELETQLALVNLGCIAVHVWESRAAAPRKPDWVCFDFDPESGDFADAARAGLRVKEALDSIGATSFAKTSGGRGLHIFVPIVSGPDNDAVLEFAKDVAARAAEAYPDELTTEQRIEAREGRVYVDPFRNGFGASVAAPYSVRRRAGAPISTPLDWSEVQADLEPRRFHLGNFEARMKAADPWASFFEARQSLKDAANKLKRA